MYTGAIDLVDINGKVKNIWKKEVNDFSILGRADDNIVFTFTYLIGGFKSACTTCMYDLKNAKLVTYESNDLLDNDLLFVNSDGRTVSETAYYDWDLAGFSGNYSNVSIAKYKSKTDDTLAYCLVDLSSKDVKFLSSNYKEMFTADGKIYLVKTYDDMWGYINADGKFLGAFDDAGKFNGKYAPVIKNGKAYLIDRNLKCVSEKISATSVRTLDDGLYYVENGSKMYLMTYAS